MNQSSAPVDVSVIMPAYNSADTIRRAIDSVRSQTRIPKEIVIVDDGSTDGTFDIVEECRARSDQIQIHALRQTNLGAGAARNRAIDLSKSDYLAFLDSDDEWLPEKLERCLARLTEGQFDLVAHNGWVVSGEAAPVALDIARRFRAAEGDRMHGLYRRGFISTSSVVARRASVVSAGGFDEHLRTGQDFDLWLKMLCRPDARYEVIDAKLTRYYTSPSGITGNTARRLDNTLVIALRHAATLHRHSGRYLLSLWFRIVAVHAEACRAYWQRKRLWQLAETLGALPVRLVCLTNRAIRSVANGKY